MSETRQDKQKAEEQHDETADRKLFNLLGGIVLAAILLVVLIYTAKFRNLEMGGPHDWALFGTYFSGLLTPVIAVVSFLLLFRMLVVQRRELKESVEQLKGTAKINADNLVQQKRFFRLEELTSSLDKLKASIHSHEINLLSPTIAERHDLYGPYGPSGRYPPASTKIVHLKKAISGEKLDWLVQQEDPGCRAVFQSSIYSLIAKTEYICIYLEMGGLSILVEDEYKLLIDGLSLLEEITIKLELQENYNFRLIVQTIGRLNGAYKTNNQAYRNEVLNFNAPIDKQAAQ